MNMKFTRTLFMLALTLVIGLSVTGGTIAWFTDSVTSSNNVIQSGNLDVELSYQLPGETDWTPVTERTNLFKEGALWEPGHTEVIKLKVSNVGNLALKYQLSTNVAAETSSINVLGDEFKLSDYIMSGIIESEQNYTRDEAVAAVKSISAPVSTMYQSAASGLLPGKEQVVTMVVYMPTSVGNEANHAKDEAVPSITLGVALNSTQQTSEADSFDNTYDADANFPGGTNVLTANNVTVTLPDDAPSGHYKLVVSNAEETNENDNTTLSLDISLTRDEQPATGVKFPVKLELDYALDIQKLLHNGNEITEYSYDPLDNVLSFETDSFSPFSVEYIRMGEDVQVENKTLTAGVFKGYDPAALDPSLAEDNSKYIAVSYTAGDKTCYAISERATTVIVAPDSYDSTGKNYTVTSSASGKLYSIISKLENNEHSTVYMLPGTYNEATTIYVKSSMDIIGLGDKDAVKVIKGSSSDSNRHLFNGNGTKADYIEVTLRNLYLDATAKTTGGKDNAAVQSIRKSKVKCYDLTIVKNPTNSTSKAFYVNGNNPVDGVKYPAYLYAENCTLNSKNAFSIVSTAGTYKFYHKNLTYKSGDATYTSNSGSIKNQAMDENDWVWD